MVEALHRAGPSVSRESLVHSLEGLRDFNGAISPTASFGPGRRIGSYGAFVVAYDTAQKSFAPEVNWVDLGSENGGW